MITTVKIENYKSIKKLKLELGRVNVLIGENLSGKTNILEAIAFASLRQFADGRRFNISRHSRCKTGNDAVRDRP